MIRFGEKLLRDFPASRWKSYIHLTLARAYTARLILTYPAVELMVQTGQPPIPICCGATPSLISAHFSKRTGSHPKPIRRGGKRGGYLPDFPHRQSISPARTETPLGPDIRSRKVAQRRAISTHLDGKRPTVPRASEGDSVIPIGGSATTRSRGFLPVRQRFGRKA